MHRTEDKITAAIRNDGFKATVTQEHDGCDHTNTNTPDLIKTPQLSMLERE